MTLELRLRRALQGNTGVIGPDRQFKSRWVAAVICVCLAVVSIAAIYQPLFRGHEIPGALRFAEVERLVPTGVEVVQLPHRWLNDREKSVHQHYKVSFNHRIYSAQDVSIYIPSVSKNFQVTINGFEVPAFGQLGSTPSWNYNRPHLLTLPSGLLLNGKNDLLLDVYADSVYDGALGVFYIGDSNELFGSWQFEWLVSICSAYIVLFSACLFAIVLGVYSVKSEPQFRWMAIACAVAVLATQRWLVVEPWLRPAQHLAFNELMVSLFMLSSIMFLYRFNDPSPTRLIFQRAFIVSLCSIELVLFFFVNDIDTVYKVTTWVKTAINASGFLILFSSFFYYGRRLSLIRVVLLCCLTVMVLGGTYENLVRYGVFDVGMDYRYQWILFYLLSAGLVYFLVDTNRQSVELLIYHTELEAQVDGFSFRLESSRQRLLETRQWSALGITSMRLWRKLKAPLNQIFESSSLIHSLAPSHEHEPRLMGLSYRSMYSAQRCLRTIDEMELLVGDPVVELIELDMERWAPELLRELHKLFRVDLRLGVVDKCVVNGDPYLLRDCIERLVDNSDRACAAQVGQGLIEVSVFATPHEVVLAVSDNGPGIGEALAARFKEPLHQGEPNGLGVGLCIVKHYSQLMDITVRSRAMAIGTCIELVFRRVQ